MINQTTITSKKEFKRLIDEMIVCIGMAEAIESLIINVHFHSIGNKQGKQTDKCRVFFFFFFFLKSHNTNANTCEFSANTK